MAMPGHLCVIPVNGNGEYAVPEVQEAGHSFGTSALQSAAADRVGDHLP